jgi:hypothetical protein
VYIDTHNITLVWMVVHTLHSMVGHTLYTQWYTYTGAHTLPYSRIGRSYYYTRTDCITFSFVHHSIFMHGPSPHHPMARTPPFTLLRTSTFGEIVILFYKGQECVCIGVQVGTWVCVGTWVDRATCPGRAAYPSMQESPQPEGQGQGEGRGRGPRGTQTTSPTNRGLPRRARERTEPTLGVV